MIQGLNGWFTGVGYELIFESIEAFLKKEIFWFTMAIVADPSRFTSTITSDQITTVSICTTNLVAFTFCNTK